MVKAWRVILAAVVIFAAGAVTGGLAVRFATGPEVRSTRNGHPSWGHRQRGDFLQKIDRELQLTPAQRENIEAILRDSQNQMKELWETIAPQVSEESRKTRQRIKAELTPEQAERFEKHFKHRKSRGGSSKKD